MTESMVYLMCVDETAPPPKAHLSRTGRGYYSDISSSEFSSSESEREEEEEEEEGLTDDEESDQPEPSRYECFDQ